MRGVVFLTTLPEAGARLLEELQRRHPDCSWTVYVRDDDRVELQDALAGFDVRSDKPVGGKVAFVRALRRERHDLAVVAWHADDRMHPMKLVALASGARRRVAYDEELRQIPLSIWRVGGWLRHALRRMATAKPRPGVVVRWAAAFYRRTVGFVVGGLWTLICLVRWRLLRLWHDP